MPDDAMEIWKREVAAADAAALGEPPASQGPPGWRKGRAPGLRGETPALGMRLTGRLGARLFVPVLFGGIFALLILLGGELSAITSGPVMALPLLLGGMAAMVTNRKPPEMVAWAVIAWLSAFAVVIVVAPVLIFLDFLDCWFSWLSDC